MNDIDTRFEIVLEYVTSKSPSPTAVSLTASEYFDLEFMTTASSAISSPPKHQNALAYISNDDVVSTKLRLVDKLSGATRTQSASYWDGQNSQLVEVCSTGADSSDNYRELILTQQLSFDQKNGWLIERWDWMENRWKPTSCAFVEQMADGTQRDYPIPIRS